MGKPVCHGLKSQLFEYSDVSYGAHNDRTGLTDGVVAALAKACPSLAKIQLQGSSTLGGETLIALFQYCPDLQFLEVTGTSGNPEVTGHACDVIRENPSWAPRMKAIACRGQSNSKVPKAMRDLSRARAAQLTVKSMKFGRRRNGVTGRLTGGKLTIGKEGRLKNGGSI
jgi:hypothetical protein